MKSKTKYYIDDEAINKVFIRASLGNATYISLLNAGEYNTAYFVTTGCGEYVLKIAPQDSASVLTYEKNLMQQEVYFYNIIESNTSARTPKIFIFDDSKNLIPSAYFIMEKLNSKPLTDCKLSKSEKENVYSYVGEMVAKLHSIVGVQFGYEQNGLHENWYLAIKSMVGNLIIDCKSNNKKSKDGDRLLSFIEKYKNILIKVESRYTHYDIWDGNIFYNSENGNIELALIDTERSYWGDCIGDFVSVEMFKDIDKKLSVASYNQTADKPITFAKEEIIRFNIMRAYLALIVYSEKFVRYDKTQLKYYVNVFVSRYMFKKSFKVLKYYGKFY